MTAHTKPLGARRHRDPPRADLPFVVPFSETAIVQKTMISMIRRVTKPSEEMWGTGRARPALYPQMPLNKGCDGSVSIQQLTICLEMAAYTMPRSSCSTGTGRHRLTLRFAAHSTGQGPGNNELRDMPCPLSSTRCGYWAELARISHQVSLGG